MERRVPIWLAPSSLPLFPLRVSQENRNYIANFIQSKRAVNLNELFMTVFLSGKEEESSLEKL